MEDNSLMYYNALYVLVWIITLIKTHTIRKREIFRNWHEIFGCSLEMVYTSSGFVIALIVALPNFTGFILVTYVGVLLLVSHIDKLDESYLSNRLKGWINIIMIVITVFTTNFCYKTFVEKESSIEEVELISANKTYQVNIPYIDLTLAKHIGSHNLNGRTFSVTTEVTAENSMEALKLGIGVFKDSIIETLSPVYNDISVNPKFQVILQDASATLVDL